MSTERKTWIDTLRAMAIFFVVLVHLSHGCSNHYAYNVFIGPIMLPLFFSVTGYLFNIRDGNQKKFYIGLFKRFIIPWFVLSLIWARAFLIPLRGFSPYFTNHFRRFITGDVLWYLPCCIWAQIIQFYIQKISKKVWLVVVVDLAVSSLGLVFAYFKIADFLNFNTAMIAQLYLMIGYLFKRFESFFVNLKWRYLIIGAILYIGLGILSVIKLPGQCIDVHLNMYPVLPLCLTMIVLGVVILFTVMRKTDNAPRVISFIGSNSLLLYAGHSYVWGCFLTFLTLVGISMPTNWIVAVLGSLFCCVVCGIASIFVNRFIPEIVGKKRKAKDR